MFHSIVIYVGMYVILCVGMCACRPRSVHEAQRVVAQADSLWAEGKMYGIDAGDSVQLAQAYKSLSSFNVPLLSTLNAQLSTSYAHACYHYGKLLRAKENPVEAMQAFISATHSRTRDYHILGRIYSNMGDIAHLAGEYSLSYDMFERSADCFLRNGDSINYYYGLYRMAYEKAELSDTTTCILLINKLKHLPQLSEWVSLTQAKMYLQCHQYESALYYIYQLEQIHSVSSTGTLIKAQSFFGMGKSDSALVYARIIFEDSCSSYRDRFNALYILTHCDSSLCSDEIRTLSSLREDIRYYEYEPEMEQLEEAVRLLHKDMNRKPDWGWLYAIIATMVLMGICIGVYVYRKQKKGELLSQKVEELKQSASAIQKKQEDLQTRYMTKRQLMEEDIIHQCLLLHEKENLTTKLAWNDFDEMTKIADKHFYKLVSKLRQKQVLNNTEIRLCVLVLLDMSRAEISDVLPYSLNGIGKLKDHTAKSLGTTGKNLRQYLINLAIDG